MRKKGKALSYVRGEIDFQDKHFSYPSRPETPILRGLNLRIPAGKTVGLVGGSGSGKSPVISLLQRFYEPNEGQILLDGHKINTLQLKWWRSQMGLVNQEPFLFETSIKENILFGEEGSSMDDVINAAKDANAHDFITKLTDGYETQVGQFGFQLSGGQKQRIAIARAVIRDPTIRTSNLIVAPSQWRLLKMNPPEWGRGLTRSLAAIGAGAVQPINAYCAGSLISNYFLSDKSAIKHKSNILALIFLFIGALNFITSLLQHYNFAVMGERLTKRVREKLLAKLMTFEIGWLDDDENTSAAVCASLTIEASMVRSFVGDQMCHCLYKTFFGSVFAYSIGLVLTWRLTLVMIAVQPLVIGTLDRKSEIDPKEEKAKWPSGVQQCLLCLSNKTRSNDLQWLEPQIDAGKTVALVGPSGSGKSTIIGLMERFYDDPLKGAVFIDWQDI
ncbi:hypothetical protein OIU76_025632 [Salix suchowensis]|nr:hypothetical protein OIU76_025632 [Salix suchowensis]